MGTATVLENLITSSTSEVEGEFMDGLSHDFLEHEFTVDGKMSLIQQQLSALSGPDAIQFLLDHLHAAFCEISRLQSPSPGALLMDYPQGNMEPPSMILHCDPEFQFISESEMKTQEIPTLQPPSKPSPVAHGHPDAHLINRVQQFMEQTGMKQHAFAREIPCSQGTLSAWLKGKYTGDVDKITERVHRALVRLEHVQLNKSSDHDSYLAQLPSFRRRNFLPDQKEKMKQIALHTPNPSTGVIVELSKQFDREPRHVAKWFSNHRSREQKRSLPQHHVSYHQSIADNPKDPMIEALFFDLEDHQQVEQELRWPAIL
eukprot:c4736_g1_i1.p1 GENE.c4736_g1_i1~~c4736_g1_i1.p1  ORF type:complete len:316 (+),score=38.50 c4736_g1_i1:1-948(+)